MAARSASAMVRGLGPVATTALVVGNMIGSGIYVVPAGLAEAAGAARAWSRGRSTRPVTCA
jgi:amino acid transporter